MGGLGSMNSYYYIFIFSNYLFTKDMGRKVT